MTPKCLCASTVCKIVLSIVSCKLKPMNVFETSITSVFMGLKIISHLHAHMCNFCRTSLKMKLKTLDIRRTITDRSVVGEETS